jgi:hypothetical protein
MPAVSSRITEWTMVNLLRLPIYGNFESHLFFQAAQTIFGWNESKDMALLSSESSSKPLVAFSYWWNCCRLEVSQPVKAGISNIQRIYFGTQ